MGPTQSVLTERLCFKVSVHEATERATGCSNRWQEPIKCRVE